MQNTASINTADLIASTILYLYRNIKSILSKNNDKNKIIEVINATHLQNLEHERPKLIDKKVIPTGTQLTFKLPPGIALKEWLDRKEYFECYTGGDLDIYNPDGPQIKIQVHHVNFPDKIPYEFNPPKDMYAPLPLGMAPDGEILYIDLAPLPHILVGGLPGYGKTSMLVGWTVALKTHGVEVMAIDRKRLDFPPLKEWINVAETEGEALALVNTLLKENERRQDILREHGKVKIQDLPPGTLPYMTLIVDEAAALETKQTYEGIDSLARLARATGISVILATQKPSAKLWDGAFSNTRDMMAGRISFYVSDYMISQMILGKGNTAGARLPMIKGRAATLVGERERIVQTLYLENAEAIDILARLNKPAYFAEIPEQKTPEKPKRGRKKKV